MLCGAKETSVCDIHSVFDDSAQWQSSKDPLAKLIHPLPVRIRVLHAKLLVEPVRLSARSGLVVSPREKDTARITKLPAQKCAQHFNPPRSPVYEIPVEYKQVRLGGQASFCEKRHHIVILSVRVSNNVDTSVSWNFDVHDCWLLVKESLAIFQQFAENFRGIQFFKRAVRSPGRFLERAHRLLYPLRTNVVVIVLNGNQLGVLSCHVR
mmetsp:Transcript_5552/g.10107  ORF Transcript_5552/g.10107 Transcript_5552/m.10107 type:complete len:209 (-) Transcript_5552:141-767(-)